ALHLTQQKPRPDKESCGTSRCGRSWGILLSGIHSSPMSPGPLLVVSANCPETTPHNPAIRLPRGSATSSSADCIASGDVGNSLPAWPSSLEDPAACGRQSPAPRITAAADSACTRASKA